MSEMINEKRYENLVSSGQATLKAILTLNGGASLAFLAFVGQALKEINISEAAFSSFTDALSGFIFGTLLAVLGYAMIFFTNCFSFIKYNKSRTTMFIITLLCSGAAIIFFLIAGFDAIDGFIEIGRDYKKMPE